ncbi:unnamed protein product [Effrenium voratum]|nr:unnamed protein product [Effrenium voratum]
MPKMRLLAFLVLRALAEEACIGCIWGFPPTPAEEPDADALVQTLTHKVATNASVASHSSSSLDCSSVHVKMQRGINIGNTFDYPGSSRKVEDVSKHVKWAQEQGFQHIRLPVTWDGHFDADSSLAKSVTAVVDYAIGLGLYVVINTHHEKWLKDHYDGSKHFQDQFWNLWKDIATHFKNRSSLLIFEILNEPENAFGSWSGPWPKPFDQLSIDRTREINAVGYDAVRKVSQDRMVFLSPNAMANIATASYVYPNPTNLPGDGSDACLGVTVHTYDPWDFAGDTGHNSYYGTVERMKLGLYDVFRDLHIWQFGSGTKLYIGEYGVGRRECCYEERNSELVREYYRFVANHFRANGWACAAWDDPGWFAIYSKPEFGIHQHMLLPY